MKAQVRWFDNLKGEGLIRITDETSQLKGQSIYVHYSAIDQAKPGNKDQRWAVLFKQQLVDVDVIEDSHWTQIRAVRVAV